MKITLIFLALVLPASNFAQGPAGETTKNLPSAPTPQQSRPGTISPIAGSQSSIPQSLSSVSGVPTSSPNAIPPNNPVPNNAGPLVTLSLNDAQALALKNNPQISVGRLTALASQQVTRQARSALWPTASADLTGVDSEAGSRITAGALNNPTVYPRAAAGATVTQLITDFGRTSNLISSANLAAKAESQNAIATREQVLLAVDQAFYSALQAHAILTVAQQTVAARQTVANQVGALFKNKLKSELDSSFANVNLAQAKLLLLDAQNNENAARTSLSAVLGFPSLQNFQLVEDTAAFAPPQSNVDDLISTAFSTRPEILSLNFQSESAFKLQKAERDLLFPNIRAMGVVGDTPVRNPAIYPNWYGAVGVDVNIPVFNGFLFTARSREASLRAQATEERLRDLRNRISRDVRTSWLNAMTAYDRLAVTQQLQEQANLSLSLAQSRYNLGLSSIVELTQAQLQLTQAQITNAQAGYDYRLALAVLQYQTTGI
jgi:outer membrane protein